jgi:hypothetical protein
VLPEVSMKDVNFPDLVDFLRDVDPGFQVMVSYAPGVAYGTPRIQDLRLKNVTAEAVLQLLGQAYPQLTISAAPVADREGRIWSIRVERDRRADNASGGEATPSVWRLREAVDELVSNKGGDRKKALDALLSLVQATLEAIPNEGAPPVIKLHEATETLVFRGTREQALMVHAALDSLRTPRDEELQQAKRRQGELEQKIVALQGQLENAYRRAAEAERQAATFRELAANAPATRPVESPAPAPK